MRILLVGPSPEVPGGIGSWIRLILAHPIGGIEYVPVHTLTPDTAMADFRSRFGPPITRLAKNFLQMMRVLHRLPRLVHENAVAGAHIHFSSRGSFQRKRLVADRLSKLATPYVLHAHSGGFDVYYERTSQKNKERIVKFINSPVGFISLAHFWQAFYERLMTPPKPKLYVMPNPVVLPEVVPEREGNSCLRLIFLGRMGEHKGSDRVLRAMAQLPAPVRNRVEAWFAGDGDIEGMHRLAQELGLEGQVYISGWIGVEERNRWLAEADCLILPSRAEGMPMTILEALAWGLPVISSPVGGIPEVVRQGQEGIFVESDDISAISEAIRFMVEHPEERLRMGHNARQRAHEFALPEYRRKLRDIYVELFG